LTPDQVKALVHHYGVRFLGRKASTLTPVDATHLLEIVAKVQAELGHGRVFVRMSNRSPKDGCIASSCSVEWSAIRRAHGNDANGALVEILRLQMCSLACRSADDVMALLLSSERVYRDNIEALNCAEEAGDVWRTSIVLRPWISLRECDEWRVFVCNRRVTAISQYCHLAMFAELQSVDLALLAERIREWVEHSVMPALSPRDYDSAVVDVALLGETIKVIEINPFDSATGPALFCWKKDAALLHETLHETARIEHVPIRIVRQVDQAHAASVVEALIANEEIVAAELSAHWRTLID
jgi:hypothetical protein